MAEIESKATESPFQSRVAQLASCSVRYFEATGPETSGRPVLMLHGWPQDALMWRTVAADLAGRRRLIAPDLRGFGQSAVPGYGYDARYFALDQIALLDHLGIEKVDLIGHDWGGWTALLLGLAWPGRIGSILAASTPHPWVSLRPDRLGGAWRILYTLPIATPGLGPALHRDGRYTRAILGAVASEDRHRQSEALRQPARAKAMGSLYRYYFKALWRVARGGWNERRLLPRLHLMSGRKDRLIPASMLDRDRLADHAPHSSLEILPDAGHFLVDERPELVVERARRLFEID